MSKNSRKERRTGRMERKGKMGVKCGGEREGYEGEKREGKSLRI